MFSIITSFITEQFSDLEKWSKVDVPDSWLIGCVLSLLSQLSHLSY